MADRYKPHWHGPDATPPGPAFNAAVVVFVLVGLFAALDAILH